MSANSLECPTREEFDEMIRGLFHLEYQLREQHVAQVAFQHVILIPMWPIEFLMDYHDKPEPIDTILTGEIGSFRGLPMIRLIGIDRPMLALRPIGGQ